MAKKHVLKAEPRQRTGSGVLKQMRREGWVPSVIYGRGSENKNLKVDAKAFDELLAHATSENIIINLDLGGANQLAFLHIGDVKLPSGVAATHAADVVIAHVAKTAAAVSEEATAGA